jgi:hypothetical protein
MGLQSGYSFTTVWPLGFLICSSVEQEVCGPTKMNVLHGKTIMNSLRKIILAVLLLPYGLILGGAASNQLVLIANHDKFPVMVNSFKAKELSALQDAKIAEIQAIADDPTDFRAGLAAAVVEVLKAKKAEGMMDDIHCIMTTKTRLNFLADVFNLKDATYSIGDFGIITGEDIQGLTPLIAAGLVYKKD